MNANNKQHDMSYSHFLVAFDRQLTYLYKLNSGDFLTGDVQVRCFPNQTQAALFVENHSIYTSRKPDMGHMSTTFHYKMGNIW